MTVLLKEASQEPSIDKMAKKKQKKKKFKIPRIPSVYDIRGIDADAMDATIKDIPKYTKEALKEQAKPENMAILAAETFFPYAKVGRGVKSMYKSLKNRKRVPAMKEGGKVEKYKDTFDKRMRSAEAGGGLKGKSKAKKYKKGGMVKKCKVDGIAKRGFTKAYSTKKGK